MFENKNSARQTCLLLSSGLVRKLRSMYGSLSLELRETAAEKITSYVKELSST